MRNKALILIAIFAFISTPVFSATIPYTVASVKGVTGTGFVELLGPGNIKSNAQVKAYKEGMYLKSGNISTLEVPVGLSKNDSACIMYISGKHEFIGISVRDQSCIDLMNEIGKSRN